MDKDESVSSIGSIKLEYASQGGQKDQVSKTTDVASNTMYQCVSNKNSASSLTLDNNMFNINLDYDINQVLNPEEWDSEFYATSLHGAMKHVTLNIKNIKDSL